MAVIYAAPVKTARITQTRDYFAGGTLELLSASDQVLAVFVLTGPGGTVAGDVWTLAFVAGTVQGTAAAGVGTNAAKAQIKTSGGAAHLTGLTVALSGADINMPNTSITEGQDVTVNTATVQHA